MACRNPEKFMKNKNCEYFHKNCGWFFLHCRLTAWNFAMKFYVFS